jgi:hypothetical protein
MGIAVTQSALERIYQEVLGNYKDRKEFLWKHRGRRSWAYWQTPDEGTL